jgi:hypothetical protein
MEINLDNLRENLKVSRRELSRKSVTTALVSISAPESVPSLLSRRLPRKPLLPSPRRKRSELHQRTF